MREAVLVLVPSPAPLSSRSPAPQTPPRAVSAPPSSHPPGHLPVRHQPSRRHIVLGSGSFGGPHRCAPHCCTWPPRAPWAPASTSIGSGPGAVPREGGLPHPLPLLCPPPQPLGNAWARPEPLLTCFLPSASPLTHCSPSSSFPPSSFSPLFTLLHSSSSLLPPVSRLLPPDWARRPSICSNQPPPQPLACSSAPSYPFSLRLYGAVDHPAQDFRLPVQLDADQAFPLPLEKGAWGQERKGVRAGLWLHAGRGWGLPSPAGPRAEGRGSCRPGGVRCSLPSD